MSPFLSKKRLFRNISECTSFYLIRVFQQLHNEIWFISKSFCVLCGASSWTDKDQLNGKKKKHFFSPRFFLNYGNSWWDEAFETMEQMFSRTAARQISESMTGGTSEAWEQTPTQTDRQAGKQTDRQTSLQKESGYVLWHMLCWARLYVCSVWGQHCSHIQSNDSPHINVSFQNHKFVELCSQRFRINLLQMCVIMEAFLHMNSLHKTYLKKVHKGIFVRSSWLDSSGQSKTKNRKQFSLLF